MNRFIFCLIACFIVIVGSLIYCFEAKITSQQAFEAGAHLIVLHHKTFGNYGSMAMRSYVFDKLMKEHSMPQTEKDIRIIVAIVDGHYHDFRNLKEQ